MVVQLTLAKNGNPTVVTAVRPMPERPLTNHEYEVEATALWAAFQNLPTGTLDRVLQQWLHFEVEGAQRQHDHEKSDESARRLNRLRLAYQSLTGNHRHDADAADHADHLSSMIDGQDDELATSLRPIVDYLRRV
jgi:hypothetical protein